MTRPAAEVIPHGGLGTERRTGDGPPSWDHVETLLRNGGGTSWLSVPARDGGVHTRPVFAAWTGSDFVFASAPAAKKTAQLQADPHVSLAIDAKELHLVVEGVAARLTSQAELERASAAMLEVYEWPTRVSGDELDADYAAPTAGGPPFQAWHLVPATVHAFPTADQVEPTRFTF